MAKVGFIDYSVLGVYTRFPVKCSSSGVFSTDLPSEMRGIDESFENEYNTRNDLEKAIGALIKQIEAAETTTYCEIHYKFRKRDGVRDGRIFGEMEFDYLPIKVVKTGKRHEYFKVHRMTEEKFGEIRESWYSNEVGEILAKQNGLVYYVKPRPDFHSSPHYDRKQLGFTYEGIEMFEMLKANMAKLGDMLENFLAGIQEVGYVEAGTELKFLASSVEEEQ